MPKPESGAPSMDLSLLPITYEAEIPASYLDIMGHMNVMWYTHLFDNAVYEVFKRIGLDEEYMRESQAGGFALESHVRYLSEIRAGQHVAIHTRILGRTEKRFHMMHFLANKSKNDLASTCEVVGAHIDMRIRRMAPLPPEIAEAIDTWIEEHQALPWNAPLCGAMAP